MKSMLVILTACIAVNSAFAACDLNKAGKVTLETFDSARFEGKWIALSINSEGFYDAYTCCVDTYSEKEGKIEIETVVRPKSNGQEEINIGVVNSWTNPYQVTFVTKPAWSGPYVVFATDYDNYAVSGACMDGFADPILWTAYRSAEPNATIVSLAEQETKKAGVDLGQNYPLSDC